MKKVITKFSVLLRHFVLCCFIKKFQNFSQRSSFICSKKLLKIDSKQFFIVHLLDIQLWKIDGLVIIRVEEIIKEISKIEIEFLHNWFLGPRVRPM